MKRIYFLSNNLVSGVNIVYPKNMTFNDARKKTMLSNKGLEKANALSKKFFENIDILYSSNYTCALETAKIIAEDKKVDVEVDDRLNERVVGDLGSNEYRFLKGMQEHDFSYKLNNGESIRETKERMESFLSDLLRESEENILVITHNTALLSLALKWCKPDFNLDDRLILEYQDEVLFDGAFHEVDLLEVLYDGSTFLGIRRIM